jgi:hypothetical protein
VKWEMLMGKGKEDRDRVEFGMGFRMGFRYLIVVTCDSRY